MTFEEDKDSSYSSNSNKYNNNKSNNSSNNRHRHKHKHKLSNNIRNNSYLETEITLISNQISKNPNYSKQQPNCLDNRK